MSPVVTFAIPDDLVAGFQVMPVNFALAAFILGSYFFFHNIFHLSCSSICNPHFCFFMITAAGYKSKFSCRSIPLIIIKRTGAGNIITECSSSRIGIHFKTNYFLIIHFNDHSLYADDVFISW